MSKPILNLVSHFFNDRLTEAMVEPDRDWNIKAEDITGEPPADEEPDPDAAIMLPTIKCLLLTDLSGIYFKPCSEDASETSI